MMLSKPAAWIVLAVVTLGARVGFVALRGIQEQPDSMAYERLASNLVTRSTFSLDEVPPFTPSIRRPPLYPLMLAGLRLTVGPSRSAIVGVQILLDLFTVAVVAMLVRRQFGDKWGFAAGYAWALHPGAIASAGTILSETLFAACLALAAWSIVGLNARPGAGRVAATGIAIGLATLCRTVAMPLAVLLPLLAFSRSAPRVSLRALGLVVLFAIVTVAPWTLRSSSVAGQFVFIQTSAGEMLYTAARIDLDQKDQDAIWPIVANELGLGVRGAKAQARADRDALSRATALIAADPGGFVLSRLRVWPYLFLTSYDNVTGFNRSFGTLWRSGEFGKLAIKAGLLVGGSLLPLVLGCLGVFLTRGTVEGRVAAAVWVFVGVVSLPMWIEPRYFLPAVPFLLVSAIAGARAIASGWPPARRQAEDRG